MDIRTKRMILETYGTVVLEQINDSPNRYWARFSLSVIANGGVTKDEAIENLYNELEYRMVKEMLEISVVGTH